VQALSKLLLLLVYLFVQVSTYGLLFEALQSFHHIPLRVPGMGDHLFLHVQMQTVQDL
jgi:hypothetical protein